MLPGFRLIVATFLCGFAVVYAGLRVAVSLNEALPMTAAHAGGHVLPAANGEVHMAWVPAMFDTRFAVTAAPPLQVRATPSVLPRPSLPLSVLPPQDPAATDVGTVTTPEPAEPSSRSEGVVATARPDPPVDQTAETATAASPDPLAPDPQQ